MLRAQPRLGEPGVCGLPARLDRVQVREVGRHPAPELRPVPRAAMARDHHPHPAQRRQRAEPSPVIPERVRRLPVHQRYLDVRAHVAGDEHPAVWQVHRTVPRRVRVVCDHGRPRSAPGDLLPRQRRQAREQRQVVTGRGLAHPGDQPLPFSCRHRHGPRGGVADDAAQRAAPQHVVPVRVGGPARHRAQAPRRQQGRQRGQVGDGHRGIDDQAAAVRARDDRGRRRVDRRRGDENAGRDLIHGEPPSRRFRRAPRPPAGHPAAPGRGRRTAT